MAGRPVEVEWVTLAAASRCAGCARGPLSPGARALRFRRGPRGTDRLIGEWFHGFDCLARRAELAADDEEGRGGGRDEALRELARWARDQERRRRDAGRV